MSLLDYINRECSNKDGLFRKSLKVNGWDVAAERYNLKLTDKMFGRAGKVVDKLLSIQLAFDVRNVKGK